ncbi:MAG: 23S rRNA (uracil-5-)-methyltransferase RumA [Elusimicrobia bacterium RIFOXYB2_FULL_48_7]|nr:MAG: 23S rRNA (uracil-5-)-methyltransferase RumA [Elusimicrobia bacterium RIFOXYB2_FULL_48_7]
MTFQNCRHFGACGGCSFRNIPYPQQLDNKQKRLESIFEALAKDVPVSQIIPCPAQDYYRNKMEFVFSDDHGKLVLGLHKKHKFDQVIDIEECPVFSPQTGTVLETARRWARENKLNVYNEKQASGTLRYLVLRESKSTKQLMANLIVNVTPYMFDYGFKKTARQLSEQFLRAGVPLACMTVGLNDSKSDVALAGKNTLLHGNDFIEEKVGGVSYKIHPYTFFQTNSSICAKLYETLKEAALSEKGTTAFDLFCGSGGIALYAADVFEKIIGIELNPGAVENAKANAALNKITNCEFICERVENYVKKFETSKFKVKLSTVIIDPPRAGLPKKTVQAIIDLNPASIIYVSCNPGSLAVDLQSFLQFYNIVKVQPFDMFPHTPHLETLVKLTHK